MCQPQELCTQGGLKRLAAEGGSRNAQAAQQRYACMPVQEERQHPDCDGLPQPILIENRFRPSGGCRQGLRHTRHRDRLRCTQRRAPCSTPRQAIGASAIDGRTSYAMTVMTSAKSFASTLESISAGAKRLAGFDKRCIGDCAGTIGTSS